MKTKPRIVSKTFLALSVSSSLGLHLLHNNTRFALAVLLTHFALLQSGTMQASVACFAQATLNTVALDLGALQLFYVICKLKLIPKCIFKRDLAVFEVWNKLVKLFRYCTLSDTIFITESSNNFAPVYFLIR